MNTIGKTLVVLNFLFAIAIGIFLVLHFAVRTRWKEAYEKLESETKIMQVIRIADNSSRGSVLNDYQGMTKKNEELRLTLKDGEDRTKVLQGEYDLKITDLNLKLNDAAQTLQQALVSKQRLVDEIKVHDNTIETRQIAIAKLEADVKSFRLQAIANEARARTLQIQNEGILEQLRGVTGELARIKNRANPDAISIRPNEANPPSVMVKGKIERVDAEDGTLVQISVGSDHGVNKNHTLDVYRILPEPKYLGTIRIVESYHQKSVGRLVAAGNPATRLQLRADDIVTSSITK